MKTKRMKLTELNPAAYNPRSITESAMRGLTASIERFGCVEPIIWNERTGNVVGGHQRLKVLQSQGEKTTDVVVVDLPEVEEKALNLSLNNPAITGDFTADVTDILAELGELIPDALPELLLDDTSMQIMPTLQDVIEQGFFSQSFHDEANNFSVTFTFDKSAQELVLAKLDTHGKDHYTKRLLCLFEEDVHA